MIASSPATALLRTPPVDLREAAEGQCCQGSDKAGCFARTSRSRGSIMAADVAALLASYARLGLFKHISTVCSEVIAKRGNDPVIVLWSAFGSAMEGEARGGARAQ